jgi:hypothetical protein
MNEHVSHQKDRERAVLNHLLAFGEIAATVVEGGEAPDFILDIDGRRVGVEVTDYLRGRSDVGSAQRQQHAFIRRVLSKAKSASERAGGPPLYVTVDWLPGRASDREDNLGTSLAAGSAAMH